MLTALLNTPYMFCGNCGISLEKNAQFCSSCGSRASDSHPHEEVFDMSNKQANAKSSDGSHELIEVRSSPDQLMQIRCGHCGMVSEPKKWTFRTIAGVFYLFTLLNVIGVLVYFTSTNPYICKKCNERDQLTKILNNRKEIPIKSQTKRSFAIVAIIFLILGIVSLAVRISND